MRKLWIAIGIVVGIIVLLTGVPLLFETNPPVVSEPKWDSPQTRALAARACFDCHSNETQWTSYTRLPGVSLVVLSDTLEGRSHLNFSEWGSGSGSREGGSAREIVSQIQRGTMPPKNYLSRHPEANLSDVEKQQLIDGFTKTLSQ